VIIAGSIGSLLAAALLYWIGRKIPQHHLFTLVERYGKYLRISVADLEKSLAWFEKYGHRIVFFGRMIPAVRSLISIPAGMSKMPFGKFMAYSAFGTIIWTTFLAFLGYHLSEDQALMSLIMQRASYIILAIVILYIIWKMAKKFGQKT
jgi:membrane protein DedA with SNARE-associated domain